MSLNINPDTPATADKEAKLYRALWERTNTGVLSRTTSLPVSPPPSVGDIYIIPTGDPEADSIAFYYDADWHSLVPDEGWTAYVIDDAENVQFVSGAWSVVSSGTPTSRQVLTATGLTGGGNLTADRTIALDINALTEDTSPLTSDFLLEYDVSASAHKKIKPQNLPGNTRNIYFTIDGGGSVITTGIKGDLEIPFACTILQATALADQSGSIVVDIWKDTYANYPPVVGDSIVASAPVTISATTKSQDATLTGWTTAIASGDILRYNVNSITTLTRVTINLKVRI